MAICQHKANEDHIYCTDCGECREDLNDDDVCADCDDVAARRWTPLRTERPDSRESGASDIGASTR